MLDRRLLSPLRDQPGTSALLLDIDGTLVPIVARSEDARASEAVREALAQLARRFRIVACVSGRRSLKAREMIGLDTLTYIGNHGYELLEPQASEPFVDPAAAARAGAPAAFLAALDQSMLRSDGLRLEDKGPIQALHWRGAEDEEAAAGRARQLAAEAHAAGLVVHWGRKVLELRPVAGIDKGSAVHRLLIDAGSLAAALYAGDDRTDLDAFRALRRLAASGRIGTAICAGVSSDEGPDAIEEEADLLLSGPGEVLELLRELLE